MTGSLHLGCFSALGRDFYAGEDYPRRPDRDSELLHLAETIRGKASAVGETVSLSGMPYTIVGVLPQGFQFGWAGKMNSDDAACLRLVLHPAKLPRPGGDRAAQGWSLRRGGPGQHEDDRGSVGAAVSRRQPRPGATVLPLFEVIVQDIRPFCSRCLGGRIVLVIAS